MARHIPRPFTPELYENGLVFEDRWTGTVVRALIQEMRKMRWQQSEDYRIGAEPHFIKEPGGKDIVISLLPSKGGGPDERSAITIVEVRMEG